MQLLANLVRLASFSSAYVKEEAIFHMIERVKETIFHVAPEMLDQMLALGYGKVLLTPEFWTRVLNKNWLDLEVP